MRKSRRSRPPRHGRDVRSMCVVRRRGVTAPRRLVGDGVYWDRLRVSGRVCGATCAAPRKNRRRRSGAFPSSRRRKLHHRTRRASERWAAATASTVAPRRRAAHRPAPCREPTPWLCSALRGGAGRAAAAARSMLSRYTLGPLRTRSVWCWRLWWWFLGVLNSRMCETISSCASGVKTLARLGRGFRDLLWQLKWLPLAYRKRLCSSAPTYAQLHAAAQHLFKTIGADAAAKLPPTLGPFRTRSNPTLAQP